MTLLQKCGLLAVIQNTHTIKTKIMNYSGLPLSADLM